MKIKPFITSLILIISFNMPELSIAGKDHYHPETQSDKAIISKIWWNQKQKINKLSLTDEQRHDMDHILGDYLKGHSEDNKAQKEAFNKLATALASNNKQISIEMRDNLKKVTSNSLIKQVDMMIEITDKLSAEQKEIVSKEYPKLFSRLWIRSLNPAAMQLGQRENKKIKNRVKKKQ